MEPKRRRVVFPRWRERHAGDMSDGQANLQRSRKATTVFSERILRIAVGTGIRCVTRWQTVLDAARRFLVQGNSRVNGSGAELLGRPTAKGAVMIACLTEF